VVWCGVICDQLIGLYTFPKRLTGDIYANFLQDELPALLETSSTNTVTDVLLARWTAASF